MLEKVDLPGITYNDLNMEQVLLIIESSETAKLLWLKILADAGRTVGKQAKQENSETYHPILAAVEADKCDS